MSDYFCAEERCPRYYTVVFRAAGSVDLTCELSEGHAGLHRDRIHVWWTTDAPLPAHPGGEG